VTRIKTIKTCALIVELLPLPPSVEGHAPTLVRVVDGIRNNVINQPLVMEK